MPRNSRVERLSEPIGRTHVLFVDLQRRTATMETEKRSEDGEQEMDEVMAQRGGQEVQQKQRGERGAENVD